MTPQELATRIDLCRDSSPSLLREYVQAALEMIEHTDDKADMLPLATALVEVGRKKLLPIPAWITGFLSEAIDLARSNPSIPRTELVLPLLTLYLRTYQPRLQREAQKIIRASYRTLLRTPAGDPRRAPLLRTVLTHPDYIPDFDPTKI